MFAGELTYCVTTCIQNLFHEGATNINGLQDQFDNEKHRQASNYQNMSIIKVFWSFSVCQR